jgi:hypothetical protein
MAKWSVVVTRTQKYAIEVEDAKDAEEAKKLALTYFHTVGDMSFFDTTVVENVKEVPND